MPISVVHEPEHGQLVLCVGQRSLLPGRRLEKTVEGLFEALPIIRKHLDNDDIDYFGLDVAGSHRKGDEFNPASEEAATVWGQLVSKSQYKNRLKSWMDELVDLYTYAASRNRNLRECGELELGAVAGTLLSVADVTFVPHYARLVSHFDPEHSVYSDQLLDNILEAHGYCTETEELLIAWAVSGRKESLVSQLLPQLQRHYGDYAGSPFFRRMVEAHYWKYTQEWRTEHPDRSCEFDKIFHHEELDQQAKRIIAELEAAADDPPNR
jgi:hypothetical protein